MRGGCFSWLGCDHVRAASQILLVKLSGVHKGRHVTMKYFGLLIDRKIIGMFSNHFM